MQTRSMTKHVAFEIDIDFDEASKAWKENKISKGNGTYGYKCEMTLLSGKSCSLVACPFSQFCARHKKRVTI